MTKRAKQWKNVLETFHGERLRGRASGICRTIFLVERMLDKDCLLLIDELFYTFNKDADEDIWIFGFPFSADEIRRETSADERETAICLLIAINS